MQAEWKELDRRMEAFDDEFAMHAQSDAASRRLATIPGIGVLNATVLVAAVDSGESFARGRDLAAWLGLVPRPITTGGNRVWPGSPNVAIDIFAAFSIHGARSAMRALIVSDAPLGRWLRGLTCISFYLI